MKRANNFKDLSGMKFNRLQVVGFSHAIKGDAYWNCICECGNSKVALGYSLKASKTSSCGCLAKENAKSLAKNRILPNQLSAKRKTYSHYAARAAQRGYSFDLNLEEFLAIMELNCYYCDKPPSNVSGSKFTSGGYVHSGIDRVDNSIGYTIDNCVACCKECNYIKSSFPMHMAEKMVEFKRSKV